MHKTKKRPAQQKSMCFKISPYFLILFLINDFGVAESSSCHHKEPTTPPANAVASTRIPYTMPSMPLKHLLPKLNALGTFQIPCFWRCGHVVHGDIKLKRLRNKLGRMHSTLHHVCLNRFPGNGSIFVSLSKTAVSRILESPLNPQSNQKKQPFNVTSFSWIQKNSGFPPRCSHEDQVPEGFRQVAAEDLTAAPPAHGTQPAEAWVSWCKFRGGFPQNLIPFKLAGSSKISVSWFLRP